MKRRARFHLRAPGVAPLAVATALLLAPPARADEPSRPPTARACALLPIADLEALYGAKASPPSLASDSPQSSFCSVVVGDHSVVVQSAAPDAAESRTTVAQVLRRFDALPANRARKFEMKDFGDVGCYRTKAPVASDGPPPLWGNVCFLVEGGKLTLELTSDGSKPIDFEVVRGLLRKAAARRAGEAR